MARTVSRPRLLPIVSLLLLCTGASPRVEPDQPAFTFHTDTDEVRLTFSATDQNDHGVATLQPSDFVIVDRDIIVRHFQSFTRSDWTQLEIGVIVDNSESVLPQFRRELSHIVELIFQTQGVPEESFAVFTFRDSQPALLCAGDCRRLYTADRWQPAQSGQFTPLFDTVVFADDFLSQHGDAHAEKALIIYSDGIDTISRNTLNGALESSLRAGVEIFAVDLHRPPSEGAAVLYQLAGATGGRYFSPASDSTRVLNAILDGFHASYEVHYRLPSRDSGFHRVRVLPTHNLSLQFRSQSGYYFPEEIR